MTPSNTLLSIFHIVRRRWGAVLPPARARLAATSALRQPAFIASLVLAVFETAPVIYYGRALARSNPASTGLSIAVSFVGTFATYLLAIRLFSPSRWLKVGVALAIAVSSVLLQVIYFGVYREFAALPTVSIIDFVRQTPDYALALFRGRLDGLSVAVGILLIATITWAVLWGLRSQPRPSRTVIGGLALLIIGSLASAHPPFMSVSQQAAWLAFQSSHGPGVVNQAWEPRRVAPEQRPARYPVNVVIFRLEEIAAQATTLDQPTLPTTPILKALTDQHPDEAFIGRQHYANATATDVSVLSIHTGLSPAAELEAHQQTPILWDYFAAAGYDTSLFVPYHLEWGKFRTRFNARPDVLHLHKVVDAGNSGLPIVYDNSINDVDVVAEALAYQEARSWAEPFLQIVSLKMPHAIGEGARVNKLSYGPWGNEPPELRDYYNGIRHNDILIDQFINAIPPEKRERTVRVYLSDHGTRLFPRTDGVEQLHRLDNYHYETTRVPFVVHVPRGAQAVVPTEKVRRLRANLAELATSNIDMVPTLLGLTGIRPVSLPMNHPKWLVGRDLTQTIDPTDVIVQLNTGPLRRWDREHFGLVLDNGSYHYIFSMGRELLFDVKADSEEQKNLADDLAYSDTLQRGRLVATQLPELLRIQQKYKATLRREDEFLVERSRNAPMLQARTTQNGVIRIEHASSRRHLLFEYALSPPQSDQALTVQFEVKVTGGSGRLEWRLRGGPSARHFVHVDTLRAGDSHRLEFLWQPSKRAAPPLAIQLHGTADEDHFSLVLGRAQARVADVKPERELKVVALERQPIGETLGVYHLDRFKEHACLQHPEAEDCPNGYLVWGPYVKGEKGTEVHLRYDIDTERAGANVWFDLAARGGKERLAKSRVFRIAEPGSHSFELSARLETDADGLEGRMNASGDDNSTAPTIAVRQAELMLASPLRSQ